MTPEERIRQLRIKELFQSLADETDPVRGRAWLNEQSDAEPEVRDAVLRMAENHWQHRSEITGVTESWRSVSRPLPRLIVESERFEIIKLLGHGGFGNVYEAVDRERGTPETRPIVAVKHFQCSDSAGLVRF